MDNKVGTPVITDDYKADFTENLKTNIEHYQSFQGMITNHYLENGVRHNNNGPALSNSEKNYHEWWDKGRL